MSWTIRDSAKLYGISNWGGDYFSISTNGDVQVHPNGAGSAGVNLPALVEDILRR
jgi:arginine decarboxylase